MQVEIKTSGPDNEPMDESFLYQKIAEDIRRKILVGSIKPGERVPSIRTLKQQWSCTFGTIQHAYRLLADEGLVISEAGKGTHVVSRPQTEMAGCDSWRRAKITNKAETFLLEALVSGYNFQEVQESLDLARKRLQSLEESL
jgi:DNA-binding transcriptional regulator YhcF (GntR family)